MDVVTISNPNRILRQLRISAVRSGSSAVMLVFLFIGVMVGVLFGCYSEETIPLSRLCALVSPADAPLTLLLRLLWPLLALIFMAESCYGLLFAPILVAFRAYAYGAQIAASLQTFSWDRLLQLALTSGMEALLLFPCLIVLAADCAEMSSGLIALRLRRQYLPSGGNPLLKHLPAVILAVSAFAVYHSLLLPMLVHH